ncbi:MAG TPA: hypothetical protein VG944_05430 [Fimbriimonas sp.]|nr:hypothetical protein [Fimbriimonas sp.]
MLGVLITILFALGAAGVGEALLKRLTADLDPALRLGLSGLVGLAGLGLLTLPIALLPGGAHWGVAIVALVALLGSIPLWRARPKLRLPSGYGMLIVLAAVLVFACSLVGVLAPSDSFDWDTLAYHLAVPKIWLQDGQMHYISFIHHSNFPLSVDALYIWGLLWGGQAGAKAFSLMFAIFGAIAIFGFARGKYGEKAGWVGLLAYVGIPMVAWEAGTAYIDIGNGLFVGLGILFAAEYAFDPEKRANLWLSGICLGFAAGSKYTGLQTIFVVAAILLAYAFSKKKLDAKSIVLSACLAGLISAPWYVKNIINTGNPVYPFFYSVFKGKNWDAFSDAIYKDQQQTFGAGREFETPQTPYTSGPLVPTRIGAAVMGLSYQPGRYADPRPTQGQGFPFVSLGAAPLLALLIWCFSGKLSRFEGVVAASVLVSLAMWFVLSEQSRYIVGLAFSLCVLGGGLVGRLKVAPAMIAVATVQVLASIFVFTRYGDHFSDKLKVVIGGQTSEEYQKRVVSFYEPAQDLNQIAKNGRVALYDEVFGYFLDVPYFWANPGHTTEMGYEQMQTSDELVASLKRLGITYVYINLGLTFGDRDAIQKWMVSAQSGAPPYPDRAAMMSDPRSKYKVLLAEAASKGQLTPYKSYGARLIFSVQ